MMSAKPEAWVGESTVECSAGKPLTQGIFGLDEALGCPGGHRLSVPQQRACGLGHHRSPSPLLLPGLGMSGSWYLSPLEDLKLVYLPPQLALTHNPKGGQRHHAESPGEEPAQALWSCWKVFFMVPAAFCCLPSITGCLCGM